MKVQDFEIAIEALNCPIVLDELKLKEGGHVKYFFTRIICCSSGMILEGLSLGILRATNLPNHHSICLTGYCLWTATCGTEILT